MKPIRNSARAIIIENGKVLLTKNSDASGYFYLFPGGGQEPGEELREAVIRECIEEIGKEVNVGELMFVREYIGKNHEFAEWDYDFHQIEFYFSCTLESTDGLMVNGNNPDSNQVAVKWIDIDALENIRLYPKTLGEKIKENLLSPVYLGDTN